MAGNASACFYHPPIISPARLVLTVGLGPLCALFGLCANATIVYLFVRRMSCMHSHLFYLCVLAVFDMTVEVCYVGVFSVQIVAEHLASERLWTLWHDYVIVMAAIGQTAITGAAFMMVAASFERYLVITHWAINELVAVQRCTIVVVVFVVACVAKGPVYGELTVRRIPCESAFEAIKLGESDMVRANGTYRLVVMFYVRHGVCVFLPFFLLVYLNVATVLSLRRHLQFRGALMRIVLNRASVERHEANIRSATRMLVSTVAAYVLANTLNIVLTTWEHVDRPSLERLQPFYAISADVISYLTLMCGVIRLPIYCACNAAVRVECRRLFVWRWPHATTTHERTEKRVRARVESSVGGTAENTQSLCWSPAKSVHRAGQYTYHKWDV